MNLIGIRADVYRYKGFGTNSAIWQALLSDRTFRPILTLRSIQSCVASQSPLARLVLPLLKLLHRFFCAQCAMDFSHQTIVGSGFRFTHGWGTVISPNAVFGRNCTVFHGVTIGQKDRIAADGTRISDFPRIGNECWIGPGAILIGGVSVGDGAIIGAGAVVLPNVPSGAVVAGNPAVVVRTNAIADVFNRPPTSDS